MKKELSGKFVALFFLNFGLVIIVLAAVWSWLTPTIHKDNIGANMGAALLGTAGFSIVVMTLLYLGMRSVLVGLFKKSKLK